jgi:hypothetical protein
MPDNTSTDEGTTESADDHWSTSRLIAAKERHSLITEAVSLRMELLLREQLSERQYTPSELTAIAKQLIVAMVPTQNETGTVL